MNTAADLIYAFLAGWGAFGSLTLTFLWAKDRRNLNARLNAHEATIEKLVAVVGASDRNLIEETETRMKALTANAPSAEDAEWAAFCRSVRSCRLSERLAAFKEGRRYWQHKTLDKVQPLIESLQMGHRDNALKFYNDNRRRGET